MSARAVPHPVLMLDVVARPIDARAVLCRFAALQRPDMQVLIEVIRVSLPAVVGRSVEGAT
jgi:hypothetical protein